MDSAVCYNIVSLCQDAVEEKVIHEQEAAKKKAEDMKRAEEEQAEEMGGIAEESDSEVLLSQTDDAKVSRYIVTGCVLCQCSGRQSHSYNDV